MSDSTKPAPPPAAIRITRPYATEDEYLEHELDMLTRTTVTLVGAQARPQGVVLRFELVLASGHVVLRGEGRVLAFRPDALRGAGGLTLRFTRLDSRSKSLVDRAAGLRDQRRPSAVPSAPSAPPVPPVPRGESIPAIPTTLTPMPPIATLTPPPVVVAEAADGVRPAPPGRDELLGRLRARAKRLDPADVERILEAKRRRA